MASNPSTTNQTKFVGVRVPNELHLRFIAAAGNKTKWLLEAIEEKLDRQVQGTKQDAPVNAPVCDSKPLEDNKVMVAHDETEETLTDVIGIIKAGLDEKAAWQADKNNKNNRNVTEVMIAHWLNDKGYGYRSKLGLVSFDRTSINTLKTRHHINK